MTQPVDTTINGALSFQVLSDLHLELGQQYDSFDIPPSAPYLLLAGDVGCLRDYRAYLDFLGRHVAAFERILLVLGNHEFYGFSYESGIREAERLVAEPSLHGKVTLLHAGRFDMPSHDISVLGCTLWSHIPQEASDAVRGRVKDYQKIEGWSVDKHNSLFADQLKWLRNEVTSVRSTSPSAKIVIVTHHAPSILETSRPEQLENPWRCAFSTNILDESAWQDVSLWVFGHTHFTTEFVRNGVKVVSNQRGYVLPGNSRVTRPEIAKGSFDARRVVRLRGDCHEPLGSDLHPTDI